MASTSLEEAPVSEARRIFFVLIIGLGVVTLFDAPLGLGRRLILAFWLKKVDKSLAGSLDKLPVGDWLIRRGNSSLFALPTVRTLGDFDFFERSTFRTRSLSCRGGVSGVLYVCTSGANPESSPFFDRKESRVEARLRELRGWLRDRERV